MFLRLRCHKRLQSLCAVEQLREVLSDFDQNAESTVIRDGAILRFAFTFELARKSLREYPKDRNHFLRASIQSCLCRTGSQVVADISNRYIGPLTSLAKRYLEA